jgi:hypothetical protein
MKFVPIVSALALLAGSLGGTAHAEDLTDMAKQAESDSKEGKHLEAYDTMRKAMFQVWEKSPLLLRKALFVTKPPGGFGVYDPRPDNVIKKGEKLVVYMEPIGFEWEPKDSLSHARLVADFTLRDGEGTVIAEQEEFGTFTYEAREPILDVIASISISFPEAPAGKYVAELKLIDTVGDKSASIELPFEVEKGEKDEKEETP